MKKQQKSLSQMIFIMPPLSKTRHFCIKETKFLTIQK